MIRCITGALAIAASLGFIRVSQNRIDDIRSETVEEELLYFPNEKLLNHFTGGLSSVAADLLWLRTIKYTVAEFHNPQRKFVWLEHMCNAVADLDPYFEDAYVYGGMFMASIGSDERAMQLLERGFPENPDSWEIPFEMAKVHLLNRRDDPESYAAAIHYLGMVAERSDEPEYFLDWIDGLRKSHSLEGQARRIWENMSATAEDAFVRELAQSKLLMLDIRDNLEVMRAAVRHYKEAFGMNPASLQAVVEAGYLTGLPPDVAQGSYYLDEAGTVQNTVDISMRRSELVTLLSGRIRFFEIEHGNFPASLDDLSEWLGFSIPAHPDSSRVWSYDPRTGRLS